MDRWVNKVAVITGTSSGIGAALAKQLVAAGLKVVGLARRKDRGEELAKKLSDRKGQFHPLSVDVTNEVDVLKAIDWVKENLGPIHILINSAGVKRNTTLIDGDTEMWRETVDTNIIALSIMTREIIKNMRENSIDGHIVHINSVLGHIMYPVTDLNVYCATKYAVTALTETLRLELNRIGSKIKITSISPGLVRTEMISPEFMRDYELLKLWPELYPDDIANAIMYVLSTPPHVQVHELLLHPVGGNV